MVVYFVITLTHTYTYVIVMLAIENVYLEGELILLWNSLILM